MNILLLVLVVVGLIIFVANHFLSGRRGAERHQVMERRVEAYMQTIRREGGDNVLNRMSDPELRDVLLSAARNLRVQAERRWYMVFAAGFGAALAAIAVGTQHGMQGLAIVVVVATIALYGLYEFLGRRMREPLLAQGIDIERLRVE
jgi:hypothetical protein